MTLENALLVVNTFVNLGLILAALGLRNYLTSYIDQKAKNLATREDVKAISHLSEKGKNLATLEDIGPITAAAEKAKNAATREDIGEITRTVESVRRDFELSGKSIQAHLDIITTAHDQVAQQRRSAWLAYFDDCSELLDDLLRVSPGDFYRNEVVEKLNAYQKSMDTKFTHILRGYTRVLLFSEPASEIPKEAYEVLSHMFILREAFRKHYPKFKQALYREHQAVETDRYKAAVGESNTAASIYWSAVGSAENKMREAFGRYIRALNTSFSSLDPTNALAKHFEHAAPPPPQRSPQSA